MPASRDPLSVSFDPIVTRILGQAVRAHQRDPGRPRATTVFWPSPIREFTQRDHGGRTYHERELIRAVYYRTWREPINDGRRPDWAPVFRWGPIERRGARWGRTVYVRLFIHGSKSAKAAQRKGRGGQWKLDEGTWRSGGRRSVPWDRIDSNRRAAG